jgi:poly(hydroxyalkanoate) granule-associated protein
MVTKLNNIKSPKAVGAQLKGSVKDSAQQIWQAGLGAITRAQAEGTKAVESLVKESISIQRKTQAAAEGKLNEASHKVSSMATDISSKASGQWDKLEGIFEERVAKALKKLGVPTASEVNALHARIDELSKAVLKSSGTTAARKPAATKASAPKPKTKSTAKGAAK